MTNYNQDRDKLKSVLNKIISDEINMLEGVREVVYLRHNVELESNDLYNYFVAIDSETDHIPIGKVRQHWNKDALKKVDAEMNEYINDTIEETKSICLELLMKLSPPS